MTHREAVIEAVSQLSDESLAIIIDHFYFDVCETAYELANGERCVCTPSVCALCPLINVDNALEWLKEGSNDR